MLQILQHIFSYKFFINILNKIDYGFEIYKYFFIYVYISNTYKLISDFLEIGTGSATVIVKER